MMIIAFAAIWLGCGLASWFWQIRLLGWGTYDALIMALYHFWSLPHLSLLLHGIMNGHLRRLGYRRLLSTVEAGADGETIAPLVKLYTRRSVRRLLAYFSSADICIRGSASRRLDGGIGEWSERHFGWYVVAHAKK